MLATIKRWFRPVADDQLVEGVFANDYADTTVRMTIAQEYRNRFPEPVETPVTHPWKFDPLNPPQGWRYDPYYELWIENE
jgi:hypothetical protein